MQVNRHDGRSPLFAILFRQFISMLVALTLVTITTGAPASALDRLDGFNVVATNEHPFDSPSANESFRRAKQLGARALAIVLFLWQAQPSGTDIKRGNDVSDDELRHAIRAIRALYLAAIVKPQVWVPDNWAGAIEPKTEKDWQAWFRAYGVAITHIAKIAAEENADALVIGTELLATTQRHEWIDLIAQVRVVYPGTLLYVAHNADEAERVTFWPLLDAIGVSLYPSLGEDDAISFRLAMQRSADRLDALAMRYKKPIIIGEIGLRSAKGAAEKPWESAEERPALPDPMLQAKVLADWLDVLDRPSVHGILIWRWFTDPNAGGPTDTDFTVQNKPAEDVLRCAWTGTCEKK